jgi:hypothetical protein
VNVNTVPAAANSFKKSRRDIFSSPRGAGVVDIILPERKIFYKPLFYILYFIKSSNNYDKIKKLPF